MGKKLLKKNGKIVISNNGLVVPPEEKLIIDGYEYKTVEMPDGKIWMAEDLQNKVGTEETDWHYNSTGNCIFYNQNVFRNSTINKMNIPAGWRLPSQSDYDTLIASVGSTSTEACTKLKSKTGWVNNANGTDDYGFNLTPGTNFGIYNSCKYFMAASNLVYVNTTNISTNYTFSHQWVSVRLVKDA